MTRRSKREWFVIGRPSEWPARKAVTTRPQCPPGVMAEIPTVTPEEPCLPNPALEIFACDWCWQYSDRITGGEAPGPVGEGLGTFIGVDSGRDTMVVGTNTGTVQVRDLNDWQFQILSTISHPDEVNAAPYYGGGFGEGGAYNELDGVLAIGAPRATVDATNEVGEVFIYAGSNAGGWVYQSELRDPTRGTGLASARFGRSVAISGNGCVMAVGAPGKAGAQSTQEVFIFRRSAAGWVHRTTVTRGTDSYGFGEATALSYDGKVLAVGNPFSGGGTVGEVTIWDDVSGTFQLRQTIGVGDIFPPGGPYLTGQYFFGSAVTFTDNPTSLFIGYAGWGLWENQGDQLGGVALMTLNSDTQEYDYCGFVQGTDAFATTASQGAALDFVYDEGAGTQTLYTGSPKSTGVGSITDCGFVIIHNGVDPSQCY